MNRNGWFRLKKNEWSGLANEFNVSMNKSKRHIWQRVIHASKKRHPAIYQNTRKVGKRNLLAMRKSWLFRLARVLGLSVNRNMTKSQLVDLISSV